jgi:hypothetical protein
MVVIPGRVSVAGAPKGTATVVASRIEAKALEDGLEPRGDGSRGQTSGAKNEDFVIARESSVADDALGALEVRFGF